MEIRRVASIVLDDLAWVGFSDGQAHPKVRIGRVVVLVDDVMFRDPELVAVDVRRAALCHYVVPARPGLREGRFVAHQVRDDRVPVRVPGEVVVLVGLVGGKVDLGAAVTLRDLLREHVLPRHGLSVKDVECRDDVRELLLPSDHA